MEYTSENDTQGAGQAAHLAPSVLVWPADQGGSIFPFVWHWTECYYGAGGSLAEEGFG